MSECISVPVNPVSHEEKIRRQLKVLYTRQTREKQIFLEELRELRTSVEKRRLQSIVVAVGPRWYQALSVRQRRALDGLEVGMYQDLLEGRPRRSAAIMYEVGMIPQPSTTELMNCLYLGRDDPKEVLAQLYLATYGYPIDGKRSSYCLHARIILSSILYLGLDDLICLLQKRFAPEVSSPKPERKVKPKGKGPPQSPYLKKMIVPLYVPRQPRPKLPPPLPELSDLNEPYEEVPIMAKPSPPPPPPPPPKKRLPPSYCDKLAGIISFTTIPATNPIPKKTTKALSRKCRASKLNLLEGGTKKKKYGVSSRKKGSRKKPVPPTTGLWNAQYTINGVVRVHGKTVYILGSVVILPAEGELIHGGHCSVQGESINIHRGFRGPPPPPPIDPCDCVEKWHDDVFQHLKGSKCDCGHYYDFGHEESFPAEELPYFEKPTRDLPFKFNYDTIFELDPKRLHVQKEFNKIWNADSVLAANPIQYDKKKKRKKPSDKVPKKAADTDTVLQAVDDTNKVNIDNLKKKETSRPDHEKPNQKVADTDKKGLPRQKEDEKVESKLATNIDTVDDDTKTSKKNTPTNLKTSSTCLGMHPKPETYLKCALRLMRKVNIAARLPDLYLVPELKEWMRQRLYGKRTAAQKEKLLHKSTTYWSMFSTLAGKGYGHVQSPKEPLFTGHTTWAQKQSLNDKFRNYTLKYKQSMFRSHAYVNNLLWRTMYQAEFPDKSFRHIFFSYLCARFQDIHLMHPYSSREAGERMLKMATKRYICLPAGFETATK